MGKYSKLRSKLPAFVEESVFQEKINAVKQEVLGADPALANVNRLAALFSEQKKLKNALEEKVSTINVHLEALSQLLCEALENQGAENVKLSSGATIYIQDTPYPLVKDRTALFAWIKKNKMTDLLSVHYQTLKGLTNDLLVGGKQPPPGVEVFLKTQARLRNGSSDD